MVIVPCLKNAMKRIVINPLSSDFWRGYIGYEQGISFMGNCLIVKK